MNMILDLSLLYTRDSGLSEALPLENLLNLIEKANGDSPDYSVRLAQLIEEVREEHAGLAKQIDTLEIDKYRLEEELKTWKPNMDLTPEQMAAKVQAMLQDWKNSCEGK